MKTDKLRNADARAELAQKVAKKPAYPIISPVVGVNNAVFDQAVQVTLDRGFVNMS